MLNKQHVFLFWGDNLFGIQERLRFWKKEFIKKYGNASLSLTDASDISDTNDFAERLKAVLQSKSLFSGPRLTIVKNIEKLPLPAFDALLSALPKIEENHFLVLTRGKNEKKQDTFQRLEAMAREGFFSLEEFKIPTGSQLIRYAEKLFSQRGYMIDQETTEYFLNCLGLVRKNSFEKPDLNRLASEIGKLCSYSNRESITKESILAITSGDADVRIFDFSDAILSGDAKKMFRLASDLVSNQKGGVKTALIGLLAYLAKEIRGLALLLGGEARGQDKGYEKKLGWSPQRIWIAKKKIHSKKFEHLIALYKELIQTEIAFKTSSRNPLGIFDLLLWRTTRR